MLAKPYKPSNYEIKKIDGNCDDCITDNYSYCNERKKKDGRPFTHQGEPIAKEFSEFTECQLLKEPGWAWKTPPINALSMVGHRKAFPMKCSLDLGFMKQNGFYHCN